LSSYAKIRRDGLGNEATIADASVGPLRAAHVPDCECLAKSIAASDNQAMSMSQDQLFESVLSLPRSVRADLAFELLQSLEPPGEEIASQEFGSELHERVAAHRRGELQSFSLEETREIVRQRLSQEREK